MVLVNGVQLLSSDFFTAIGKALKGALLALTRQTFVLIPLTLLLPLRFGIMGVLLAGPVADFSAFVLSIVLVGTELRKQKMQHILVHSKMNGLRPLLTAPPVFAFRPLRGDSKKCCRLYIIRRAKNDFSSFTRPDYFR